ncbi:MAG: DUF362 domain-containing protein, partial [bacterium]
AVLARQRKWADRLYTFLNHLEKYGQRMSDRWGRFRRGAGYVGNILGGSWHGNDTAWRMALDLTHIALYVDPMGRLCQSPQRRFFSIVDGIIAGEGEGPLSPTAKPCGTILCGFNPLAVDIAAARLMGFDALKTRMLKEGLQRRWLKTWIGGQEGIRILSNQPSLRNLMVKEEKYLNFAAPKGWRGHIEMSESEEDEKTPI